MNYVLQFLLPVIVFASGLVSNTNTYIAPNPSVLTQKIELPTLTAKSQPERQGDATEPIVEATSTPDHLNSCVRHLKTIIPDLPNLDAINWPINTITPKVGDIIKFQYYNATTTKYTYHIAIITEITEEAYQINEANYEAGKETNRTIPRDDEHILGFFNMDRQRLIDALTPIQKQTLWNESGWSMYDTKGAILRGKDGEWGLIQVLSPTWEYLTKLRRRDNVKPILLDKFSFEDQIIMFKFAFERGYQNWWMGYNKITL